MNTSQPINDLKFYVVPLTHSNKLYLPVFIQFDIVEVVEVAETKIEEKKEETKEEEKEEEETIIEEEELDIPVFLDFENPLEN